jgi:lipopolysaccharide biosynthesis regulator YciM
VGADIFHILYVSSARGLPAESELTKILEESRVRNAARGITGMLVHFSGNYVQALEGDEAAVSALVEKIRRDPRHRDFKVLLSYHSSVREYPDWAMGLEVVAAPLEKHADVLNLANTRFDGGPGANDGAPIRQVIARLVALYRR